MTSRSDSVPVGPWPSRLAAATWVAAVPLVLFGGTVTTLRAGMAESGWINPDGFFLWAYPVEKRFGSVGVFVEHHHRELGSLVGLLAIATAVAAYTVAARRRETRTLACWLPTLALLAVCVQGLLGGLRVLENSPSLAFVHGSLAQAVFAFLFATALHLSPRFRSFAPRECKSAAGLQRATSACVALVFLQVTLGAWLRHSGAELAMALHVLLALGVVGSVAATGKQLDAAVVQGERAGRDLRFLGGLKLRLQLLVGAQVALGVLATFWIYQVSGGFQGAVSMGEAIFATAHVAVGALLFAQSLAAAMWARRVVCTRGATDLGGLEVAR